MNVVFGSKKPNFYIIFFLKHSKIILTIRKNCKDLKDPKKKPSSFSFLNIQGLYCNINEVQGSFHDTIRIVRT